MKENHDKPGSALEDYKLTKIIATVGPSTNSYEHILAMVKAGVNGIRMNFSHGTEDERIQQIKWIRKASKECDKPVAIIQDLQGPKVRLGDFEGDLTIKVGQELIFEYQATPSLPVKYIPIQFDLSKKLKRGETMFLNEGKIKTTIVSVSGGLIYARAENDGVLSKRKSINVPDTDFAGDIITDKDKKNINFGSHHDMDYVALSFVQSAEDINQLRKILKNLNSPAKIIAKIETKSAVSNLEEIIREADAVMVARGDLATETLPESIPILQRKIIGFGLKYSTPTIVATQMLASMTEAPEPTRAEVSDVATAVIVGADSVMLSDETAIGKYPLDAIEIMSKIILYTQNHLPLKAVFNDDEYFGKQLAIPSAIVSLAENINARAIVAETRSGATAIRIAALRPETSLIAVTSIDRVAQQLAIVYGIKGYVRPDEKLQATKLTNWMRQNNVLNKGDLVVTASGQHPGVVGTTDTIKVRAL